VEYSLFDLVLSVYRVCNQTYTGVVKAIACTGCLVIIDGAHSACKTSVDCNAASQYEIAQIEKVKNRAWGKGDGSSGIGEKAWKFVEIIVPAVILLCCCVGCISVVKMCCCRDTVNQEQQQQDRPQWQEQHKWQRMQWDRRQRDEERRQRDKEWRQRDEERRQREMAQLYFWKK
jgi:hypothetical protein